MRKYGKMLLVLYSLVIIKLIIFKYSFSEVHYIINYWDRDLLWKGIHSANLIPFQTIKMYIHYYNQLNSFENLFGNILIFIPFGMMASMFSVRLYKLRWLLPLSFVFILGIETFQLITRLGQFDIDDIMLNMFGVILGWLICRAGKYVIGRIQYQKRKDGI
ncbi:MAG: VanZ family protein [Lachnospiraceae bacterium]